MKIGGKYGASHAALRGVVFTCALTAAAVAHGASLKVAPARLIIHDIAPGEYYDLFAATQARLVIFNDDSVEHRYTLSTHRPSERGRWERGYEEIPDASWCRFKEQDISVPPNGFAFGDLTLQIPAGDQYFNQHWVATLSVASADGGVGVAVDVRAQIETASRTATGVTPAGKIGVAPSTIIFEGSEGAATLTLFNNADKARSFTLSRLYQQPDVRPQTWLMHNHRVLPQADWLQFGKCLEIPAGESRQVEVRFQLPESVRQASTPWEELLWLSAGEGAEAFARIQIVPQTERPRPPGEN